jgi:hypothetical protein
MKDLIKSAGFKKSVAASLLTLSNVAVFAAGTNGTESSSGVGGFAVVGFFVVLVGLLLIPTIGHKTHH